MAETRYPTEGVRPKGGHWRCYDSKCGRRIRGPIVWLGEHEPKPFAVPFHPQCADQPWPMYLLKPEEVIERTSR